MPGSANKLRITERQQDVLKEISNSTTSAVRLVQRATVILLAFAGEDNQDIAKEVGFNRNAVAKWRRRWAKLWHKLILIECEQSRAGLRRAIEDALADAPRSGSPGIFTPEQVTQILALACEPPEKSGRPITHRGDPSRTGPATNWPTKPRNAASSNRSRPVRSDATCARPNCNRIAADTGSTPRRRTPTSSRRRFRPCATRT
jgi:hypothetical protein